MKLWISVMTAVGLGCIGTALAEHYTHQFQKNLSSNEVKAWEAASPQDRLWFV